MNVEERKQQARLLEQKGEYAEALELYREIISELEGTPEIWRELPLYVKAGDLSLKMGKTSAAIALYEKAAAAYAAYGSAKSVIALCTKILRVNSGRTHVFLRLVRIMIERKHLAEARLVLIEYAERMKLPKAGFVLDEFADHPDERLKPILELLLELGGRYEYARAQGRGESTDAELVGQEPRPDAGVEEPAMATDSEPDETESRPTSERVESETSQHVEEEDAGWPDAEPDAEEESESQGESQRLSEEAPAAAPAAPDENRVKWVETRPVIRPSSSRQSRKVLFRDVQARKKPKALWIGLGIAAVIVVGGLSLVLFNVIPLGGGGGADAEPVQPPHQPEVSDSTPAGAELDNSIGAEEVARLLIPNNHQYPNTFHHTPPIPSQMKMFTTLTMTPSLHQSVTST